MNSYLIIFAIFLILLLIILIGFLLFFGVKFVNQQKELEQKVNDTTTNLPKAKVKISPFCVDHEEEFSVGNCSIDGLAYCELCLTRIDDMKFARKNSDEYLNYKWTSLTMFRTKKGQNDFEDRIKKAKSELWLKDKKPLIVRGHFKLNVEDDSIESFTTLMCREEDAAFMKKELNFINL